jgi:hypothetical protein
MGSYVDGHGRGSRRACGCGNFYVEFGGLMFIENITLIQARKNVMSDREKGTRCPCCDQYAKIYNRKLNSAMARSLILVDKYFSMPDAEEHLHVERYLTKYTRATDFYKLRFWGLIEAKDRSIVDGIPNAGYWKMTQLGKDFVRDLVRVPARVAIYNDSFMGHSTDTINITEALGQKFDYIELMRATL